MRKLDRLGWTAGISMLSYGVRVGIRVNDTKALERIERVLPPQWRPASTSIVERLFSVYIGGRKQGSNVRRYSLLYDGAERLQRTMLDEDIYNTLAASLRLSIAEGAKRRLFVHAGVVGWKGKGILIPGRSFSGKTTLVRELIEAGATYYSDEYAVLDKAGRVHPFAKPLSIREDGAAEQTDYAVEELGGRAGRKPLQVWLVLLSRYRKGARWRPRTLTAGQSALELLSNTVAARREPEAALKTLREVSSNALTLKGWRGEASQVLEAIKGL